ILQVLQSLGCHSSLTFSYFSSLRPRPPYGRAPRAIHCRAAWPDPGTRSTRYRKLRDKSFAIDVLRVARERVFDAVGKLLIGPIGHAPLAPLRPDRTSKRLRCRSGS